MIENEITGKSYSIHRLFCLAEKIVLYETGIILLSCGCSTSVVCGLPKAERRVRFPSAALNLLPKILYFEGFSAFLYSFYVNRATNMR